MRVLPPVDVTLCLRAGQTFGWRQVDSYWFGSDGDILYRLDPDLGEHSLSSSGRESIQTLFGLEDCARNNRMIGKGPEIGDCILGLPGLRMMTFTGEVQSLFSFLCTPNNNIKRIEQLVTRLFAIGPSRSIDGHELHQFPTLERLSELTEEFLRELKFGYRAATIPVVAKELLSRGGVRYLQSLSAKSYAEVVRDLLSLPGVGPKLADCIALFALGKTEAVPFDVHMWRAYKRVYELDPELTLTPNLYQRARDHMQARFGLDAGAAHQFIYCHEMLIRSKRNPIPA